MADIKDHAYNFYKAMRAPGTRPHDLEALEKAAKADRISPNELGSYIVTNEATLAANMATEKSNLTRQLDNLQSMGFGTGDQANAIREKLKQFAQ
ncbi:MAG: hypothetical protein HYZ15_13035 [Sphingobacteriales bacterium]|nr:hypothetical protein [Sphingobacteriales bacterium]